jgi:hypothetical protein
MIQAPYFPGPTQHTGTVDLLASRSSFNIEKI